MTEQTQVRCVTLSIDVTSDADMPRVMEVITRAMTGLVLEGLEARVYSFDPDQIEDDL